MSMEKYGVEVEHPDEQVKNWKPGMNKIGMAQVKCGHPPDQISKDGDTTFCSQCGKYLNGFGG